MMWTQKIGCRAWWFACALLAVEPAHAQLTLANPHWNITLTDYGYSDFLLDNTPGFEGREYLSGEWAAAVAYDVLGGPSVAPQWLEPQFVFPDWTTTSTFHPSSPIAQVGINADGLPVAESVITNSHLEITIRHEMIDTVVGTPMGTAPASAGGAGSSLASSRYVLKETYTIRNIAGVAISGLRLFQLLHGLSSQRGVYDNRLYGGALSNFAWDVTMAGVDPWAAVAGSPGSGLEDYIAFQAAAAPDAFELGYYGIEGNGVDDHAFGKPSDGVHLSVEADWTTPPYSTREGTDLFAPATRWIAGAQRWSLGTLAAGQQASIDILLSLRTGTTVPPGTDSSGSCGGGSSVPGGLDYSFDDVSNEGTCFSDYSKADEVEIEVHVANDDFTPLTFQTPGSPVQLWKVEFNGVFTGSAHLEFGYDPTALPSGFDETSLCLYHYNGATWEKLAGTTDPALHKISVATGLLGFFALGVDSGVSFNVDAGIAPPSSGIVSGSGTYADGSSVTLVAEPEAGYVFANWTENGSPVSGSPAFTFVVHSDRNLVANFNPIGTGRIVTTASTPANGGATTGDGEYAIGATATVVATPNAGYKFSKWLVNGTVVGTSRTNSFVVTNDVVLVAKFKPVYTIAVTVEPVIGGEVEVDAFYELGELAKLKAIAFDGYSFVNWTQNGFPVSTASNFQFSVTGNRELVAHFAEGARIDIAAAPVNGGAVTGGGVHPFGSTVALTADAMPGYVFVKWTENGVTVSTAPSFSFLSASNRTLEALFIAQPGMGSTGASGDRTFTWPAGAAGWVLQECMEITAGIWSNSVLPVTTNGSMKQVTLPPDAPARYFRLDHPSS